LVPGPPKRFAQSIGLAFTAIASLVSLTVGWDIARWILLPLVVAASLEAFAGYCLGCAIFAQLMKWDLIPESVCADCADITSRLARHQST
jgi:CHASE2 domain-containing sensor protein